MRAGRLNILASLITAGGQDVGSYLIGISMPDNPSGTIDTGLLRSDKITIRSRWSSEIKSGCFFRTDTRLFLISAAVDPDVKKQDMVIATRELIGEAVTLNVGTAAETTARCVLLSYIEKPAQEYDYQPATERRRAEFANVEYRPAVGDEFIMAGAQYRISELDADGSDVVITRVWVEFLQYTDDAIA